MNIKQLFTMLWCLLQWGKVQHHLGDGNRNRWATSTQWCAWLLNYWADCVASFSSLRLTV